MAPAASPERILHSEQHVAGRAFCDPAHTDGDLATLALLRATLTRVAGGQQASALRFADEIGAHAIAVPDWTALASAQPAALVGFFGQARDDVDHAAIVALEEDIVARAATFPGLLAYHNARLGSDRWGNLVVFRAAADTAAVTRDPLHHSAVAATPRHYASLRLHRGVLAEGCLGAAPAAIHETLYLDFGDAPAWRAVRAYVPAR